MPGASNLLWIDKHRPLSMDALTYHKELSSRLRGLCAEGDIPHLLFYGPSGAGKRTRVACILRELFGASSDRRKVAHKVFKVGESRKELEVTTVASTHHVEVNPSESGLNDRLVVQELIKDMASSIPIQLGTSSSASTTSRKTLKVIVLHEVDQMSRLAQQALRRTMEKYTKTCRIIMVCDSVTKVIEPLRSRCLGIRVPLPSRDDMLSALHTVADKEGVTLPSKVADKIVSMSGGNMRRALLQLEATRVAAGRPDLPEDAQVMRGDWEYACFEVASMISRVQSASQLVAIRKRLQDLLAHAIPADVILRRLVEDLLRNVDDELCTEICKVAAKFDHHISKGTKPLFHLEAFAARTMQIYADFLQRQAQMID